MLLPAVAALLRASQEEYQVGRGGEGRGRGRGAQHVSVWCPGLGGGVAHAPSHVHPCPTRPVPAPQEAMSLPFLLQVPSLAT